MERRYGTFYYRKGRSQKSSPSSGSLALVESLPVFSVQKGVMGHEYQRSLSVVGVFLSH